MSRIFVNPIPLRAQAQAYRVGADAVAEVSYQFLPERTDMPSIVQYLETLESFDTCITEFSDLLHKDAHTLQSLISDWLAADRGISQGLMSRR